MATTPPPGYKLLLGSEREQLDNARLVGPVDPQEQVEVTVYLRAPATGNLENTISEQIQQKRPFLSREEYRATQSVSGEDQAKIERFAQEYNLTFVTMDPVGRRYVLAGTAASMSTAFATQLHQYDHPDGSYRGRTGPLYLPEPLDQIVVGVFGLDTRPQARSHVQRYDPTTRLAQANAASVSYTPVQLAHLYDFPAGTTGSGQCIALIELGGGYTNSDLQTYFQQVGIPLPNVISVSVDGGQNTPTGSPNSADGEVELDIEVAGSLAPGAKIAVYFAPNTDQGFLDAVSQATHDTTNTPSVISISWGSAEVSWTAQAMQAMDQAFQAAVALGITVCCAAGDAGSSDGVTDGKAHVDFPSSSPYTLACGGTRLEATNNAITSEVVWNESTTSATGYGISDVFPLPTWQANAHVPTSINDQHSGRGVPDVAGDADPQTGYQIHVDGQDVVFGGTSAVAPLWAGLIALINQQRGKPVGYLNPLLYQNYAHLVQANALHAVTSGTNGGYSAGLGWDACTGLGTPDGANMLAVLATV
ncbi:MAG: S53 family peptidase [Ktedonobacteraceae bacterium]